MSTQDTAVHTTTDPNGTGWVNKAKGVVLSRHKVKVNAVNRGRALAKRHNADLTVHRKDGSVIQTKSYGMSPL